ncbi:MAG: FAD-dependent oxidoreductase, partial [Hyphomicrobiales bacterium]|nr:FAD-dependent oxidoreductase [Hyphomicrobiales bacterium]
MDQANTPILKDLVLIGGGHSHVTVLKRFGMTPLPGVRLTLICRDLQAPYSGMLPGFIAGHYTFDEAHIDLGPLARFAGARFFHAEVTGLDPVNKLVRCKGRPDVPYDLLSINIGSAPVTVSVPGATEHAVPVKPIDGFIANWERLTERVLSHDGTTRIGVVGAGAGGVELALAVQYRLRKLLTAEGRDLGALEFHLFSDTDDILVTHNRFVRAKYRRIMQERGVHLHLGQAVTEVGSGKLSRADGETFALDEILWVTMAGAQAWLRDTGLALDARGFIQVADTLESVSHPGVFAAGDVASVVDHPRPKSGVFAVRQGPPLARNLRRALQGRPAKPFRPQSEFLSLISTGDKYAVASRSWWA